MIVVGDLEIRIAARTLLKHLNLTVDDGEFVAILGRNGVGKTTLLRTLCGLHRDYSGVVEIGGRTIADYSATERARAISYVASDELMLEMLNVRDVVANGRYAHHAWFNWRETPEDSRAIEAALEAVRLRDFSHRLFVTLSSGERQRCWIALALAQEPQVMLLDEPTNHLDVHVARDILALLREQRASGRSIVCVLHELNEALEFADRIVVLGEGSVLSTATTRDFTETHVLEDGPTVCRWNRSA